MTFRDTLAQFYARKEVMLEMVGGLALSYLAYADKMPMWAVLALIAVRHVCATGGMRKEQKKEEVA